MLQKKVCGRCGYDLVEVKGSCGCTTSKKYFCRKCQKLIPPQSIKTVTIEQQK